LLGYLPPGCRDIAKYHHYYQLIFHTAMFIKIRFVSYGGCGVLGLGGKTSRITRQQVIVLNIAIARAWNGGIHQDVVNRLCVEVTRVRYTRFFIPSQLHDSRSWCEVCSIHSGGEKRPIISRLSAF